MSRAPLRYFQPVTPWQRIMLGIGGAVGLFGFYDLLIRPGMSWLQVGMAPFIMIGLIALGMGLTFLSVAAFGRARTITFDRGARACYVDFEWTFGLQRRFTHPFSELGEARAVRNAGMDGAAQWGVELVRKGKRALSIESFEQEAHAKAAAEEIAAYMAGR